MKRGAGKKSKKRKKKPTQPQYNKMLRFLNIISLITFLFLLTLDTSKTILIYAYIDNRVYKLGFRDITILLLKNLCRYKK